MWSQELIISFMLTQTVNLVSFILGFSDTVLEMLCLIRLM